MTRPASTRVTITIEDQIAHVRLNRADKLNALDLEMFRAIAAAQKQVAKNRSLRAVVLGAEGKGIRRLTRENCDDLVYVPMAGSVQSLNVSVATGVCLFEALRQRNS